MRITQEDRPGLIQALLRTTTDLDSPREPAFTSIWGRAFRHLFRDALGVASIVVFLLVVLAATFAPNIAPYDHLKLDLKNALEPPTAKHIMGTDELGRDIFSRVLHGARISIGGATLVVVIAITLGTFLGAVSGYLGGLMDEVVMRVTDIFLAFPSLILAMALTTALKPSTTNAAIALGLAWWPSYARLVRGQVLAVKAAPYVEAVRSLGANDLRIVTRHVLPNCMDPVYVRITLTAGYAILLLAGLSFIGLGAQPPTPEWGLMIAQARAYIFTAWWYPTLIGLVIFITVTSATLASDSIQDALDPHISSTKR